MRKILSIVLCLGMCGVSAMGIGRHGDAFEDEQGHIWQPIHYDDRDAGFEANIPGSPISGMNGHWLLVSSKVNDTEYEIHTLGNAPADVPRSYAELEKAMKEGMPTHATLTEVEGTFGRARYVAQFEVFKPGSNVPFRLGRVYVSSNKVYYMIIDGPDHTLANKFFDSFAVTK